MTTPPDNHCTCTTGCCTDISKVSEVSICLINESFSVLPDVVLSLIVSSIKSINPDDQIVLPEVVSSITVVVPSELVIVVV